MVEMFARSQAAAAAVSLAASASVLADAPREPDRLDPAWRMLLFNHFHDILPGSGKIETTIYGVFILAIIGNMINLQGNINSWWQQIITGLLLIIVLMLQVIPSWRRSRA